MPTMDLAAVPWDFKGEIVSDGRRVLRPCGLRGPGQQNSGHSFSRGAKGRDAGILNLPSL